MMKPERIIWASPRNGSMAPRSGPRAAGVSRLTQKPLGLIEGHASHKFAPALWMSADAYYHAGGETNIDGVNQRNASQNLSIGLSFA
jgi:hypothetical protein